METNTPKMPPNGKRLTDRTVIHGFCSADCEAYRQLNADFGLQLDSTRFSQWQTYFKHTARRDPTVGELRVLDALDRIPSPASAAGRYAVSEFTTDSPVLAETWSDMMQKHALLHRELGDRRYGASTVPPCTFEDMMNLTARYMRRTGARPADGDRVVLLTEARQEAEAALLGYVPVSRMHTESGETITIAVRPVSALPDTTARTGDIVLYCPSVPVSAVAALMEGERHKKEPDIRAIRAITRKPLLSVLADMCSGVDLRVDRLTPNAKAWEFSFLPMIHLCGMPAIPETCVSLVLCVPTKRAFQLVREMNALDMATVTLGQVRKDEQIVIYLRDETNTREVAAVSLPAHLLRAATGIYLTPYAPTAQPFPADQADTLVRAVQMARLPGILPGEDGTNPSGQETVALTAPPAAVITLPEFGIHVTATESQALITSPGEGYAVAIESVSAAVLALQQAFDSSAAPLSSDSMSPPIRTTGTKSAKTPKAASPAWDPRRVTLTVKLTDGATQQPGGAPSVLLLETICGLYRAAAEWGLSPEDTVIQTERTPACDECAPGTPAVSLMVTAWVSDPVEANGKRGKKAKQAVALPIRIPNDLQWNAVAKARYQDSPSFLLPTLRRSNEGSLKALGAALNRDRGCTCRIFPVAIQTVTVESPDETASNDMDATVETSDPTVDMVANAAADAVSESSTESPAKTETTAVTDAETSAETMAEAVSEPTATACDDATAELAEITAEPSTAPSAPHIETRELLHPLAVQNLVKALDESCTPIFAMSAHDARLLLNAPAVREAVERKIAAEIPILVLGDACRVFAEEGYLPDALTALSVIPRPGSHALVTYRIPDARHEDIEHAPVTRLVRRPLLSPAMEIAADRTYMTLTFADGRVIPDGFLGREGCVLGVLNGVDPVVAAHIVSHARKRFSI